MIPYLLDVLFLQFLQTSFDGCCWSRFHKLFVLEMTVTAESPIRGSFFQIIIDVAWFQFLDQNLMVFAPFCNRIGCCGCFCFLFPFFVTGLGVVAVFVSSSPVSVETC